MLYKKLDFDSECAIELFTACNYRCVFCSGPRSRKLVRRGRTAQDIERAIDFFNKSGKKWLIGMSGGEPTIHPYFGELVSGLREQHYFYFFTNLTFDVDKFMDLVPADRVMYMKTSLHPQGETGPFLEKYETLFSFGYNPIVIMVSCPDAFDRIEEVSEFCSARQYPFTLSVMEGPYRDQNYPNDYSADQRQFIESRTQEPGNLIRLFSQTPGGLNTYGLKCPAGRSSFYLDLESGEFRTCESVNTSFGNLYEDTFTPNSEDFVCTAINGCVGYDRSPYLPKPYLDFYEEGWNYWKLKGFRDSNQYPDNLYTILGYQDVESNQVVDRALKAIHERLGGCRTLLWGAGIYGSKVLYSLRKKYGESNGEIVGFIDSLKDRRDTTVLGLPVFGPKDKDSLNGVDKILITTYAFEDEVVKIASSLEVDPEIIALHADILRPMGIEFAVF